MGARCRRMNERRRSTAAAAVAATRKRPAAVRSHITVAQVVRIGRRLRNGRRRPVSAARTQSVCRDASRRVHPPPHDAVDTDALSAADAAADALHLLERRTGRATSADDERHAAGPDECADATRRPHEHPMPQESSHRMPDDQLVLS